MTAEENIKFLTANQSYVTTLKGYLLTGPAYSESKERGETITLITWKLIKYTGNIQIMAILTYTVLSDQKRCGTRKRDL